MDEFYTFKGNKKKIVSERESVVPRVIIYSFTFTAYSPFIFFLIITENRRIQIWHYVPFVRVISGIKRWIFLSRGAFATAGNNINLMIQTRDALFRLILFRWTVSLKTQLLEYFLRWNYTVHVWKRKLSDKLKEIIL